MATLLERVDTERLFEQKTRIKRIKSLQAQIATIKADLENPHSAKLSDMPKSQNPFDKTSYLLSKKMDLENELNRHIKIFRTEEIVLKEIIKRISTLPENQSGQPHYVYQDLLTYRFIDDCSMQETNIRLNSQYEDFEEKEESYLRNLYVWQRKALRLFRKCQDN